MKKIFFLLMLLISLPCLAQAEWNPYLMTKSKFVHLSPEQQREVIVKTMEYFVELEKAMPKEHELGSLNADQNKKVVELFKTLQDFIISSAYAQETPHLVKLAEDFNDLIKDMNGEACIYAGYVSQVAQLPNGTKYCPHPLNVKGSFAARIKQAYADQGAGKKSCSLSNKKISCNPVVFGYESGEKPFCVETSLYQEGKPQNAAYNCMRKALSVGDVEARLDKITQALSQSGDAISQTHKTLFELCVCGNKSSISSYYKEYMRDHRTCLGLMNSLKNINQSVVCENLSNENEDFTKITNLAKFFTRDLKSLPEQKNERKTDIDEQYGKMIKIIADLESSKKLCALPNENGDEPKGDEPIKDDNLNLCKTTVTRSKEDPHTYTITLDFSAAGEDKKVTPQWPEDIKASEDKTSATITLKEGEEKEISIPYTIEGDTKTYEACKANLPGDAGELPTDENKDEKKPYKLTVKSQAPTQSSVQVIASITLEGKEVKDIPEGHKIIWHYLNFPSSGPTPEKKEEKSNKIKDNPAPEEKKKDENKEEKKEEPKKNRTDNVGDKPIQEAPRGLSEYDACAELLKGKEVIASGCDKVAPVRMNQPQPNGMQQQPQKAPRNFRNLGFR